MSRILILDNYDSFTYNLAQYVWESGVEADVVRNDETTVEAILEAGYDGLLISPGPCTPAEAGISEQLILEAAGKLPIFGVCLGMQAIGEAFGGRIVSARRILHGKPSSIRHDGRGVFQGLENPFQAIRYHSLAVQRESLPECLIVSAEAEDGEIMGIRHARLAVEGVQFHPESIGTDEGKALVRNWVRSLA
ncbi:MAG: glutamine amidotransferase [Fimbriimonadales bacterium]|nr:MAG: glutamine amidotransferase [Fimbriimonadales bacterium]